MLVDSSLVGRRIEVDGSIGTVRYQGEIDGKKGEWLGIEWDDEKRGKHSGDFNGRTYFTTTVAGSGSFIAASKQFQEGRSVVEALQQKYLSSRPADSVVLLGGDTKIQVTTVGWEKIAGKQSKLAELAEIGLAGMNISHVADSEEQRLRSMCPSVTDIDLSRNLFASWRDVARIVKQLPRLQSLRLSGNRMAVGSGIHDGAFQSIAQLTLMATLHSWEELVSISGWFSTLEELHAGFNNMELSPLTDLQGLNSLRLLNLEHNRISSWTDVKCLGLLPNLQSLNLNTNRIPSIEQSNTNGQQLFARLTTLNLSDNLIATWKDIHLLNSYPSLVDVRIKRNPITAVKLPGHSFSMLAGRLRNVMVLNGSRMTDRERLDAELYYLSECARVKPILTADEFDALHPRFDELCDKHGAPEMAPAALTSNILKNRLAAIQIVYKPADKRIDKSLPITMKLRALKSIASRLLAIPNSTNLTTTLVSGARTECLNDDLKELSFYGIASGDQIIIE